ncbi:hypothetical protein G7046_g9953 [Stylonectria norvegica]|nr:hypothetical protein G7046_g9953 [Stylonectria norvegica]
MSNRFNFDAHTEEDAIEAIYRRAELRDDPPLIPNVYEPFQPTDELEPFSSRSSTRSSSPCAEPYTSYANDPYSFHSREPSPSPRDAAHLEKPRSQRPLRDDGAGRWIVSGARHTGRDSKTPARGNFLVSGEHQSHQKRELERRQARRQSSLEDWKDAGDRLFAPSPRNKR